MILKAVQTEFANSIRNVPPIGLAAFFRLLAKAQSFSQKLPMAGGK